METHVTDIPKNPSLTLSRRSLLRDGTAAFTAGGAVMLAAALFPSRADAAAKVSRAAAGYQTSPKNDHRKHEGNDAALKAVAGWIAQHTLAC
jgi:hypothetical protein